MIGSFAPLDNREHRWVKNLRHFGVVKVGIHDQYTQRNDFMSSLITKISRQVPYCQNACVTYMGFGFNPSGMLFRNLDQKTFFIDDFVKRDLRFYVSQKFEENLSNFKFGHPVVLLEGILDVESFCFLTKYPFVIGYLTSYVRPVLSSFLASITNKILIVPDNDKKKDSPAQLRKSVENFSKLNIIPKVCTTSVKDFGEVFDFRKEHDVRVAVDSLKEMM